MSTRIYLTFFHVVDELLLLHTVEGAVFQAPHVLTGPQNRLGGLQALPKVNRYTVVHTRQCTHCTVYSMYGVKEKVRRSMVFAHFSCSWWQPCLLCRIFLIFLRKINLNLIIHTVFACYMNFLYFIVYRTLFYKENHNKKYLITYQTLKLLVSKQQKIF